jgi:hypothetical protein
MLTVSAERETMNYVSVRELTDEDPRTLCIFKREGITRRIQIAKEIQDYF